MTLQQTHQHKQRQSVVTNEDMSAAHVENHRKAC
jgi:hypothetical protein